MGPRIARGIVGPSRFGTALEQGSALEQVNGRGRRAVVALQLGERFRHDRLERLGAAQTQTRTQDMDGFPGCLPWSAYVVMGSGKGSRVSKENRRSAVHDLRCP